eukprot:6423061-Karenia_brevis.AAC.1
MPRLARKWRLLDLISMLGFSQFAMDTRYNFTCDRRYVRTCSWWRQGSVSDHKRPSLTPGGSYE